MKLRIEVIKTAMKNITSSLLSLAMVVGMTVPSTAAEQTATLKVSGNCGSCKKRIVRAAEKVESVSDAAWDKSTKVFTAKYDDSKTNIQSIRAAIVEAGHDVDSIAAKSEVYSKLPECCQFRNGKEH